MRIALSPHIFIYFTIMATHASLKEFYESNAIYGGITGNFLGSALTTMPQVTLCVQKRHSIDLYSINNSTGPAAHFSFILSYPIHSKIRQIAKVPVSVTLDAIVVWCEECKVLCRFFVTFYCSLLHWHMSQCCMSWRYWHCIHLRMKCSRKDNPTTSSAN